MKFILRYNSNREVSGPIILLRLTPHLVSQISKNYCLKFVIQGFLGVARNLFAATLFWGQQTLWCLTKSTTHFLIFIDHVYIFIFIWFFMQQTKGYFFGMETLSCWTFWTWFQPNRAFLVLMASSFHLPVTIIHKYPRPPTPSLGYL